MAVLSPAKQLGYGGAAGGGKTDLICGLALTAHKRSLILRHEGTQLTAIEERFKEIIQGDEKYAGRAKYNSQKHVWSGLPERRFIQMGGLPNIGDEKKFQGQPHDLKAYDEATEIAESQIRFINGWNRSADPFQRCRQVFVFNPPTTVEGRWVIKFWAPWLDRKHPNPAKPGELRYFTTINGEEIELISGEPFLNNGKLITPVSRTFIPAKLVDNQFYAGGDYESVLQALPEPLRSQMLNGDFGAGIKDDDWQVIPTAWVLAAQERWKQRAKPNVALSAMGVDVARGGSDKTVLALRYNTWFAPLIKAKGAATPDGPAVANLVIKTLVEEGQPVKVAGPRFINVDVIGVGASAYDSLKKEKVAGVYSINVAERTDATDRTKQLSFLNVRAEGLWKLREALDPATGDGLALPDDPELLADLTAPLWKITTSGIQIESKEDIKKRIGRSPDCGDALVLAHYLGKKVHAPIGGGQRPLGKGYIPQ